MPVSATLPATQDDPLDPLALARALVFSPIGGQGLVEQAVRRLGEAIGLGLLEVGDRLPPESELAARFGIAPMTLREALAILRQAGYLETRRGRGGGTFVRRAVPQPPASVARAHLARLTVEELRDLTDYRRAVAGAGAALAAERATPGETEALRELVEQMERPPRFDLFRRLDSRFHVAVASAARSTRLTAAEAAIQADLAGLLRLIPHPSDALRVSNQQHRAVLEAIVGRRPDTARSAMEAHVQGTGDFLVGLRLGKVAKR